MVKWLKSAPGSSEKSGMNRESFLETVKKQYVEEIHEAFLECEHQEGGVDFPRLSALLGKLMNHAKAQGLTDVEFEELVHTTLPETQGKLDLRRGPAARKAA